MNTNDEFVEIEIDEETYATAKVVADEMGISVDELVNQILQDAIEKNLIDKQE